MSHDVDRLDSIRDALRAADLYGLVCALPANVLLLSGYWPVVGTSLAVVTRDGAVALLVPEDERGLAARGRADAVRSFRPGSLTELRDACAAVHDPLAETARALGLSGRRVGYEAGPAYQPASYVSMHLYGAAMAGVLGGALGTATLVPADELLAELRSRKTPAEVGRIRTACRIAAAAFEEGRKQLRPGLKETEAASCFRAPLLTRGVGWDGVERAGGEAYCRAGPDASKAYAAYQMSTARPLAAGEFALIHCNSYADGYFTDLTRTYCLGPPTERQRSLVDAILAARQAALAAICPGVRAADVDRAARDVLTQRGLGPQFKHSTGHGVGFAAIDHNARPRLHPCSQERLRPGMVFNVEPGVYLDNEYGVRHCDMVAVTADGAEVLTPFHASFDELICGG